VKEEEEAKYARHLFDLGFVVCMFVMPSTKITAAFAMILKMQGYMQSPKSENVACSMILSTILIVSCSSPLRILSSLVL
jgi:hypothetical protein